MDRFSRLWPAVLLAVAAIAVIALAWFRKVQTSATTPVPVAQRPAGLPLPTLVDADGDGDEDLLIGGRLVDGVTWATRWTVPGTLTVLGRRGVAISGRSLKVIDLKTGAEVASETLSVDIATTCPEGTKLVVRQSDGSAFTYDPASASRSDGALACHPSDRPPACVNARADCSLVGAGDFRLATPPIEVRVQPATGTLVGLDGKGNERYSVLVGTQGRIADLDLASGRVFVFRNGVHVFDAETGAPLWQNDVGKRMRVGFKHVYVSVGRDNGPDLDVLDAGNGSLVTTLRRE